MSIPTDDNSDEVEQRRSTRRAMIKKTVAAGVVAWAVPAVIDSVANPAAAATCAQGNYYVAFQSTMSGSIAPVANACTPTAGYTNVNATTFGLTATFDLTTGSGAASIAHAAADPGNTRPVTLSITNGCSCRITRVVGMIHEIGPSTCPNNGCAVAATGNVPLQIVGGALGTLSVKVQPFDSALSGCPQGVHWGQPASGTMSPNPANKNGGNGYLIVEVTCP